MATVHDLAAYILAQQGETGTMKLQKLVYYCQAWSLVWDGAPLFAERVAAWEHGPVVPELYDEHRQRNFVASLPKGDAGMLDEGQRATVDAVLKIYGAHTDWWLRQLAHAEQPWVDADQNATITTEEMAAYYSRFTTTPRHIPPEIIRGFDLLASIPDDAVAGLRGEAVEVDGYERWLETGEDATWQPTGG